MPDHNFSVYYTPTTGLLLTWKTPLRVELSDIPVRVYLKGDNVFSVWGVVDSGEGAPVWAEPGLELTFFGDTAQSSGMICTVETTTIDGAITGYRATAVHPRATVELNFQLADGELAISFTVDNPVNNPKSKIQNPKSIAFPLAAAELAFENIPAGEGAYYLSAHPYGGRTHGYGAIAELGKPGVQFVHGCIGQALPVVYLHTPDARGGGGVQFEFMLEGRPIAWLKPVDGTHVDWTLSWSTERLLEPGQAHRYGGVARFAAYRGRPVAAMRGWRDSAAERYGLVGPPVPGWARAANIIEFNMAPANKEKDFTRLDDPRCRQLLESWKAMGFTAIFAVANFRSIHGWLSPLDYTTCEEAGGDEGERQMLQWAHELGFHIILWVTTVGIDRDAPEVHEHPEWFTHRRDGSLFYAWDSNPGNNFVGYAPDGDPLSTGWREWLQNQVGDVIGRGYDGIFIDGCIPRASNHMRYAWPAEGRNGVEDQVRDLAEYMRTLGPELITFVEDESLLLQTACEIVQGRYHPVTPYLKKAYWDHGMGGGPEVEMAPPSRIPQEMVRDYLLVRYASLLPGVVDNDIVEGYISEEARAWTVQSLLSGRVPKTHSQYVDFPETFHPIGDGDTPSKAERAPAHRLRGHDEFTNLIRFCRDEPLVHGAQLSIEGVEVEGDAAVVGLLRPTADRCLLTLIQFANRQASVRVRLAAPDDVPAIFREEAGNPQMRTWTGRELMHSMLDEAQSAEGSISGDTALEMTLQPYGFRIFELTI